ncbi:MAG TPA: IPT/TIG domain-containing protein [Myxococcales bacterium]
MKSINPLAMLLLVLALGGCDCGGGTSRPDASFVPADASGQSLDGSLDVDAGDPDGGKKADSGLHEVRIKSVLPSRGLLTGGVSVTIEGGGFYQGFAEGSTEAKKLTRVRFGANEVAQLDIIDDDTMEVTAPPNPAGPADVVIINPNGTATCTGCFTYFLDLSFDSISPARGSIEGGLEVELKGDAFTDDLTVLIGGKACPELTVVDPQTARATVPPGSAPGPVDVRVFNKNGVGEIRRGFTYFEPLRLDRAEPSAGPIVGGGTVKLVGKSLTGATKVLFGTAEASFAVVDDGTIDAVAPAAASAGAVDLKVETPAGTATRASGYVYFDPSATGLAIAGVWPTHGPAAGGNTLTIVGAGFDAATVFQIDGVAAAVVSAPEPNVAVVTVPAGAANRWVAVSATGAATQATLGSGYHYNLALDSLAPVSGKSSGGDAVVLTGAGFVDGLEVLFGALPATGVSLTSATAIAAVTPPGSGATDVRVRDPADRDNEAVLKAGFKFVEPVFIGRVSPDNGAIAGGTYVTVLGTGFGPGLSVLFGGALLKDQRIVDAHTVVGHTPPGRVGAVDVKVQVGAETDQSLGAFSYFDPTSGGGGSSGGPLNGTLNVTILESSWLHYGQPLPGATVMLGSDPTTPFQGKTDRLGQITFSDPQLMKAQTVTVSKDGYQTITIASQESQNLTLYLSNNNGDGGPPDMPPPGGSSGPAIINGHVTGFKLPRPLGPHETAWAEVWVASTSVYSTPPFGSRASADQRDARGERWKLTGDGAAYSVYTSAGLRAVYAVYGIYDRQTDVFTPYLLGVRRGINADPDRPALSKDIVLDVHLDRTFPVHFEEPALSLMQKKMARTSVYGWLELGAEGVIPLGSVDTEAPDVSFGSMPNLDGSDLIFLAYAHDSDSAPTSYVFRKQLGDLTKGLSIGPMLPLPRIEEPTESFSGTIGWRLDANPEADLARLSVSKIGPSGYASLWSVIMPGAQRSIAMPRNLYEELVATGEQGDLIIISMSFSRAARFDWAHWSYSSLGTDAWTAWANVDTLVPLFAPAPSP